MKIFSKTLGAITIKCILKTDSAGQSRAIMIGQVIINGSQVRSQEYELMADERFSERLEGVEETLLAELNSKLESFEVAQNALVGCGWGEGPQNS